MNATAIDLQAKRAHGRSLKDFKNLSWAEKKLIACAARGRECILSTELPDAQTRANAIRPELIRFLALGGDEAAPVHEKGLRVVGAFIGAAKEGESPRDLDLDGCKLSSRLGFFACHFDAPIVLRHAEGLSIACVGATFPGLDGDGLKLNGDLFLHRAVSTGTVRLLGAKISGDLLCRGGQFENAEGEALSCDRAEIGGSVFFDQSFRATGEVRLLGAKIGGNLYCDGGRFENTDGGALSCDGAEIGGRVSLKAFRGTGEVRLLGAKIGGNLICEDGRFENADGNALSCDRAEISGNVFLDENFHATGEVRLLGAKVDGDLLCRGGRFENAQGAALSCDGVEIGGSAFLDGALHATGGVRLLGAKIGGNLYCDGALFENADGHALSCDSAEIGGALFFHHIPLTLGRVSFAHTHVATLVDDLPSWPEKALYLDGFRYDRIAASAPLDAKSRIAWLDRQCPELLAGDSFALQPWTQLAKVLREQGHFRDAAEVDIAREDRQRAAGKVADRSALNKWLRAWGKLGPDGRYTSFFSIVARLDDFLAWALHWLYGRFSGYGHRPMRIVYSAVILWLTLAGVYHLAASNAHFAPANPGTVNAMKSSCKKQSASANINWTQCEALLAAYPRFSPLAYSLDLILPVARLGQSNMWTPISDGSWLSLSGWTQRLVWLEEIFGWVAALTLGAIAAGLVKRRDG